MIENEQAESRKDWMLHLFKYHAQFKKQNSIYMFWQKTNYPIELNYHAIIDEKIEYIHNNPVEAGYVIDSSSWYYSSACIQSSIKVLTT